MNCTSESCGLHHSELIVFPKIYWTIEAETEALKASDSTTRTHTHTDRQTAQHSELFGV